MSIFHDDKCFNLELLESRVISMVHGGMKKLKTPRGREKVVGEGGTLSNAIKWIQIWVEKCPALATRKKTDIRDGNGDDDKNTHQIVTN